MQKIQSTRTSGAIFVILSAIGFGALAIFGKVAYAAGVSTATLLAIRFILAGGLMVALLLATRQPWPSGRDFLILVGMGGLGYAGQAFCFFSALKYATAGLTGLLLYLYPVLVIMFSALLGRQRLTWTKTLLALISFLGILLTVANGIAGTPVGIFFGTSAAMVYTLYILVGEGISGRVGAVSAGCVIMLSAAAVFTLLSMLEGIHLPQQPSGWLAVCAIAVISTLMPIVFFYAGMRRLGAGDASTLSTLEPVVTLALAYMFLGEKLCGWQLLGATMVVASVVVLTRMR